MERQELRKRRLAEQEKRYDTDHSAFRRCAVYHSGHEAAITRAAGRCLNFYFSPKPVAGVAELIPYMVRIEKMRNCTARYLVWYFRFPLGLS